MAAASIRCIIASHISLSVKNYRDVMGGAYFGHPPLRPFQVHATANAHPITAGMKPFVVNDEQHYVDYDKDPRYVILEVGKSRRSDL